MNSRRVLAELARQLVRKSTLALLTGFVLLVGLMGMLAALTGESFQALTNVPYLFAPTLLVPIAAHRVLEDPASGMTAVHATTPMTRGESLAAKALAVGLLTPLAVLVSLPVLYASLVSTAPGALLDLWAHPAWALSIGTTAASVGLLIGHLTPDSPRLGVGLAFGIVLVWMLFGLGLGKTPNPPLWLAVLRRLSPVSYAIQAVGDGPLLVGPALLGVLPLTLAAWALALLVPVSLGLQHAGGWHTPLRGQPRALAAAVLLLVLGATALVPWQVPETTPPEHKASVEDYHGHGDLWLTARLDPFDLPDPPWTQGVQRHTRLTLVGEPNATVQLEQVVPESQKIRFESANNLPRRVDLDRIVEDHERRVDETGGPVGTAQLNLTFRAYPRQLFNHAPTELTVAIDGQAKHYQLAYQSRYWKVDRGPVLVATVLTAIPLAAATRWLPGRWNGW